MLINLSDIYSHNYYRSASGGNISRVFWNMPSPYITIVRLCHTNNQLRRVLFFFPFYALRVVLILH